ncbi:hypothetical protein N8K70_14385 [Microbacterium betulae]|uniref:Uncharacterized protein n=1 Tax=Microbacterium betulae TaxID=2981139 RepID=A0AA97FJ95_9MICO|nr:hypothetical protein [Microbacterium sp. AB]WOF22567.1 hypothetical protein N8K70_14385 [Microbacterium sp. AB]
MGLWSTEDAVRRRWGSLAAGAGGPEGRAETVAGNQADADPRVTETRQVAEHAHRRRQQLNARQMRESIALSQRALGGSTPSRVIAHAVELRKQSERDRRALARSEALPVAEAAQLVRELAARDEAERQALERAQAARQKRIAQLGSRVDDILNGRAELSTFEQTCGKARALLDDLRK